MQYCVLNIDAKYGVLTSSQYCCKLFSCDQRIMYMHRAVCVCSGAMTGDYATDSAMRPTALTPAGPGHMGSQVCCYMRRVMSTHSCMPYRQRL